MIKIYLHRLNDIEEVFIPMIFCSQIIYLKIDQINNREIELFLRQFLTKIQKDENKHLRLLCFGVPAADDQSLGNFNELIHSESVCENIYLQWK
jgi:hypothetical protein